jgi:hypothetical protein
VKINFTPVCPVHSETIEQNERFAKSLGYPRLGVAETPRLAVIGGGPSINELVDEIRDFDGDIWAINGAFKWCYDRRIKASFFSIDPREKVRELCAGAEHAVLSMGCDRSVFLELRDYWDASIEAVRIGGDGIASGPTTATAAPHIAALRGYKEVVFYGCESSYGELTHAYGGAENDFNFIKVLCNGHEFMTAPCMVMQVEMLSEMIREVPSVFKERSGGLLAAAVQSPEIDVLAVPRRMYDHIMKGAA